MKLKSRIVAMAVGALMGSAASAATYVQYVATFVGVSSYSDFSTNYSPVYHDAISSVTFNLGPVDSTYAGVDYTLQGGLWGLPGGSLYVGYGPVASSIVATGMGFLSTSASLNISLGAAVDGGLTDFEGGSGRYSYAQLGHGDYAFSGRLVSFTTEFADTSFGASRIVSGPTLPLPEPSSWTMMIGGFGVVGAAMRRRKFQVSFA